MAGFTIERSGFLNATTLIGSMIDDLVDNGFTMAFPLSFDSSTIEEPYKVTLEAGPDVDPLSTTQPWRIAFDVQQIQTCFVYVGTPLTLPNDGSFTFQNELVNGSPEYIGPTDTIGACGVKMGSDTFSASSGPARIDRTTKMWIPRTFPGASAQYDEPEYGFINRRFRIGANSGSELPMRYRISITDRGLWIGVWQDSNSASTGQGFNWILVQRPVDRVTGDTIITGKAPVWCVNYNSPNQEVPDTYTCLQFVVRESDILRPGPRRIADVGVDDSDAIFNTENQVSLSEDGKYIVTFPARLNTARYCYSYELDMIGITSADVVSQDTDVPLTVYEEPTSRIYIAMQSSRENNTGFRTLVLKEGGGIDPVGP